jgi:hypothetical protein
MLSAYWLEGRFLELAGCAEEGLDHDAAEAEAEVEVVVVGASLTSRQKGCGEVE